MLYRTASADGTTTEKRFTAELFKDWLLPGEDYFYFANGRYDWDDFQDWDSRWSGFGGIGYQFLRIADPDDTPSILALSAGRNDPHP
jgi:hypothetical protein